MKWKVRVTRRGQSRETRAFPSAEAAWAWAYANITPDDGTAEVLEDIATPPWRKFNEGIDVQVDPSLRAGEALLVGRDGSTVRITNIGPAESGAKGGQQ